MDDNSITPETNSTKTIILEYNKPVSNIHKKKIEPKPKKKRVITTTSSWNTHLSSSSDFEVESQKKSLDLLLSSPASSFSLSNNPKMHFLREQIRQKINGYKAQDIKKGIYSPFKFITLEYILRLLSECDLSCFYCHEPVYLWYEISREAKQWSVERIENTLGHDVGNVAIACLSCNLKRRCMYHERYVFTKNLSITKLDSIVVKEGEGEEEEDI